MVELLLIQKKRLTGRKKRSELLEHIRELGIFFFLPHNNKLKLASFIPVLTNTTRVNTPHKVFVDLLITYLKYQPVKVQAFLNRKTEG